MGLGEVITSELGGEMTGGRTSVLYKNPGFSNSALRYIVDVSALKPNIALNS